MITITEDDINLTKLTITRNNSSYHIDVHIKIPDTYESHECLLKEMLEYINTKVTKGDPIGLYETVKKFIFENNIEYYELYKIG